MQQVAQRPIPISLFFVTKKHKIVLSERDDIILHSTAQTIIHIRTDSHPLTALTYTEKQ